eukprot:13324750-Ditylum_brightwellii.AAC.1
MTSLSPPAGSELGGTNVTIRGLFPTRTNNLKCLFDDQESIWAKWISREEIVCTSPTAKLTSLLTPAVNVSVLINGEDKEHDSLQFSYHPASHISSLSPLFGYLPGGTMLHISGGGFVEIDETMAMCMFGDTNSKVKATVISGSLLKCIVPESHVPRTVTVGVSFNSGYDFVFSDIGFTYIKEPVLNELFPKFLPLSGGIVSLKGEHFSNISKGLVWCFVRSTVVEGHRVNDTTITFVAPAFDQDGSAPIRLSINGIDFSQTGPILTYLTPPQVKNVFPSFAHHEAGGIIVTVTGSGFQQSQYMSCVFSYSSSEKKYTSASFVSERAITCPVPTDVVGVVSSQLEVSLTGDSYHNNPSIPFGYRESVHILSINPQAGPIS